MDNFEFKAIDLYMRIFYNFYDNNLVTKNQYPERHPRIKGKRIYSMEFKQEYLLNGESIDSISDHVNTFLEELKTERKNQLRIRLLVEDLLLDWQEKFSEEAKCLVKMGKSFGRPYISLEVEGENFNPLLNLAITVAAAVIVGMLGMYLPDELRMGVLNNVLTPIYDTFF